MAQTEEKILMPLSRIYNILYNKEIYDQQLNSVNS